MIRSFRRKEQAFFIASLLLAGSAQATGVSECLTDVSILRTEIAQAQTFLNPNKDQTGLLGKADSAYQKLDRAKFSDAASVLAAMRSQVASLVGAAKPKLGALEGAAITAEIDTSSICVVQLMTQP